MTTRRPDVPNDTAGLDNERLSAPRDATANRAVSFPATAAPEFEQVTQVMTPRNRVQWGPIWAGILTSLASFLILSTLAISIGLQALPIGATNTYVNPTAAGITSTVVTIIIALISFFIGGFVTARMMNLGGRGIGAFNGFLVWALGAALIMLFAAFGLGSLFGALGGLADAYRAFTGSANVTPPNVTPEQVASAVRNSAIGAFIALVLSAIAAALGGYAGARDSMRQNMANR